MRQERRGLSWPKIIGLTLLILISVYAFLPTISGPGVSFELSRNMKSAKDILTVSRIYAESHQGKFPETVIDASAQIWGHANPDKSKYYEIRTKRLENWLYYPGAELDSPGTRIVLAAPRELPSQNGSERRRIVGYADGHVDLVKEDEFQHAIRAQSAAKMPKDGGDQ